MKSKPVKIKEKRNVKGTVVNGKNGSYFRKPHQRTMEISAKQNDVMIGTLKNDMKSADVIKSENISTGERGVTNNVLLTTMKNKKGEIFHGYYKPIKAEPFISDTIKNTAFDEKKTTGTISDNNKKFTRDSVKLLDRETEKPLSQDEHIAASKLEDGGREKYKGHMIDREIAAKAVANALQLKHLPDVTVKKVNNNRGLISKSVFDQFKNDTIDMQPANSRPAGPELLKNDPKIGDKFAFDFLIGNLDRHSGNVFVRQHGDYKNEMIGFDHGFSFPSRNIDVINEINFNDHLIKSGYDKNFTPEFKKKIMKFKNSDEHKSIAKYIEKNIGKKSLITFNERLDYLTKKIMHGNNKFSDFKLDYTHLKH